MRYTFCQADLFLRIPVNARRVTLFIPPPQVPLYGWKVRQRAVVVGRRKWESVGAFENLIDVLMMGQKIELGSSILEQLPHCSIEERTLFC